MTVGFVGCMNVNYFNEFVYDLRCEFGYITVAFADFKELGNIIRSNAPGIRSGLSERMVRLSKPCTVDMLTFVSRFISLESIFLIS